MAPGHFNAIFLKDCNPLEQKDWKDSFEQAKEQDAFIFGTTRDGIANSPIQLYGGTNTHKSITKAGCME